jgi:predicted metal-dependent enzyme (double-stranded beta helix superfamily)
MAAAYAPGASFDELVEPARFERSHVCVHRSASYDMWLVLWGPDSRVGMHDHGGCVAAVYVVSGELVNYEPEANQRRRVLRRTDQLAMSPAHVHEVVNESSGLAASVHAYSPPLETMRRYATDGATVS